MGRSARRWTSERWPIVLLLAAWTGYLAFYFAAYPGICPRRPTFGDINVMVEGHEWLPLLLAVLHLPLLLHVLWPTARGARFLYGAVGVVAVVAILAGVGGVLGHQLLELSWSEAAPHLMHLVAELALTILTVYGLWGLWRESERLRRQRPVIGPMAVGGMLIRVASTERQLE